MKRFFICLFFVAAFSVPVQATELETTLGYGTFPGAFPFTAQIALSNLNVLENPDLSLGFALSTERAGVTVGAGFDFGPLGRASTDTRFDVVFSGGVRFRTNLRGTLGPIALELDGGFWTASSDEAGRFSMFERNPEPASSNGFLIGANAQYRLSRNLTLKVGGRYVPESSRISVGVESRVGEFTLSGGVLLAPQTQGLTYGANFGLKYVPENAPYRLNAEIFLGANQSGFAFGTILDASYDFLNIDEEKIGSLTGYLTFEPWREDLIVPFYFGALRTQVPLRFGVSLELNLGPGVLIGRGFGGFLSSGTQFSLGQLSYGFQLGYRLNFESLFGG